MEGNQDEIKSIKVIKFNNRKEDWAEFALRFKAIADERGYDKILEELEVVPADDADLVDEKPGREQLRLRKVNKRGYRDPVLVTKEMSLTIVGNAKTDDLPSGDLQLA